MSIYSTPDLPKVHIPKAVVDRAVQAFHLILTGVEPLGILFRKSQGSYNSGYFKRGSDRLYLSIDETHVERSGSEGRVNSWQWGDGGVPSGRLSFTFETDRYVRGDEKQWTETKKLPMERLLPQIISGIRLHFLNLQRRHIQEAIERKKRQAEDEIRWREWRAQEAIRQQQEREQMHINALESVKGARKMDLIKASEWWRLSCAVTAYLEECERRWRNSSGELNPDQKAWLEWARQIASDLSPFSAGYPDAAKHGAFDPSAIPAGGPYPTVHDFPQPFKCGAGRAAV